MDLRLLAAPPPHACGRTASGPRRAWPQDTAGYARALQEADGLAEQLKADFGRLSDGVSAAL